MLEEFKKFLFRGNVLDLLAGVVIGVSFGALVNTLVSDLVIPLISVVIKIPDLSGLVFIVNGSKFMYGHLVNAVISFLLITGSVFFFIIKPINVIMVRTNKRAEAKVAKVAEAETANAKK
jgi:large conductance mechanosensitive channel